MIILSFAFYGGLLLVFLTSFPAEVKVILSSTLVILGEASFWIAVLILGRRVISQFRNLDWRSRIRSRINGFVEKFGNRPSQRCEVE
ncbi:MAG: transporter suffix domain-containing protein [Methanothrix sp.]|nr:transporter suffix domain-containing protein [Methanothrix sp.]